MRRVRSLIALAATVCAASGAGNCSGDGVAAESGLAKAEKVSTSADELLIGPRLAIDWNHIARQMQPNANVIVPHTRMFAIIHVGLHDGINAVLKRFDTWAPPVPVPPLPNALQRHHAASAAGVQAAYELATLLVPTTNREPTTSFDPKGQPILPFGRDHLQQLIDAQHADHMAKIPEGTGKRKGIEAGHEVALRIWNLRENDNATPPNLPSGQTAPSAFFGRAPKSAAFLHNWWSSYMVQMQTPPIGVWRQHPGDSGLPPVAANYPVPFPSFNWWDTVAPFGIDDANQFMAGPPPAPNQEDPTLDLSPNCAVDPLNKFACQMEKTRALGANDSAVRTADQTSSARWWGTCRDAFAFSKFAATLSRRRLLDMAEAARVFALASIATADAAVVQKANKNRWNYWRPIASIRQLVQPDWCPLLPTPPDQEYIAGHPTVTAAGLTALKNLFGNQFRVPITLASEDTAAPCVGTGTEPPSRTFTSLDEAIEEVIMARVWGGMHYEVSGRRGADIGRQIGDFVVANKLKPKD